MECIAAAGVFTNDHLLEEWTLYVIYEAQSISKRHTTAAAAKVSQGLTAFDTMSSHKSVGVWLRTCVYAVIQPNPIPMRWILYLIISEHVAIHGQLGDPRSQLGPEKKR